MNDLHALLSLQHRGLRTFKIFQQKLETLSRDKPEHRALRRLLSCLVGSYLEAFDEEPLPVAVADRAYHRLAWSQASIFELARSAGWPTSIVLQRPISGIDTAALTAAFVKLPVSATAAKA